MTWPQDTAWLVAMIWMGQVIELPSNEHKKQMHVFGRGIGVRAYARQLRYYIASQF